MEEARQRNRVSPEGIAIGEQMVRLTEPAIRRLAAEGAARGGCSA